MEKLSYPVVPLGSVPKCFNCSSPTDPRSLCHTGYSHGNGSQSAVCRSCGNTTYFDFAAEVPPANEAHVVAFSDGGFLGQARTRVTSVGDAVLFTRSEAARKMKDCEVGTYSIIPLRSFNLDALRDQAAREAEEGR